MKTYEKVVVSITLLIVIIWFLTGNFGGAQFSASSGLSFKDIKGAAIVIGKEKEESLRKIHEILRKQKQIGG